MHCVCSFFLLLGQSLPIGGGAIERKPLPNGSSLMLSLRCFALSPCSWYCQPPWSLMVIHGHSWSFIVILYALRSLLEMRNQILQALWERVVSVSISWGQLPRWTCIVHRNAAYIHSIHNIHTHIWIKLALTDGPFCARGSRTLIQYEPVCAPIISWVPWHSFVAGWSMKIWCSTMCSSALECSSLEHTIVHPGRTRQILQQNTDDIHRSRCARSLLLRFHVFALCLEYPHCACSLSTDKKRGQKVPSSVSSRMLMRVYNVFSFDQLHFLLPNFERN